MMMKMHAMTTTTAMMSEPDDDGDHRDAERAGDLLFEIIAHRLERGTQQRGFLARDLPAADGDLDAVEAAAGLSDRIGHAEFREFAEGAAASRRLLLRELFQHHAASAVRAKNQVALHFLDLDGFKGVNDRLGHAAGDAALVRVAELLVA